MRTNFLIQQCLCAIALVSAAQANDNLDHDSLEFGRVVLLEEFSDAEVRYRDLIEDELLFMSMSLSMSIGMSLDYNTPTKSPTIKSTGPTQLTTTAPVSTPPSPPSPADSVGAGCDEQMQSVVSVVFEVDTAIGKDVFADDLVRALKNALLADFSFCDSRRLEARKLEDLDFLLGDIAITEDSTGSCTPQSSLANQCRVASTDFVVSGENTDGASRSIQSSLETIIADDQDFEDELQATGIIDVRLEDITREAALNGSLGSGDTSEPARPAMVAVLSVAAVTVVAALVLRKMRVGSGVKDKDDHGSDTDSHDETTMVVTKGGYIAV